MSLLLALIGGSAGAYTLTASTGAYALSGQSANLLKSRVLVSAVGGYALTGVAAGLLHNYRLTAAAGAYSYSGISSAVVKSRLLAGSTGAYALVGVSANVLRSKKVASGTGAYSYVGNNAAINYTPISGAYTLSANAGSYSVNGQAANLTYTGVAPTGFNGGFVMRTRKVYVKRGKQYLIFNNHEEADAYLAAEQAIEAAKKSSRGAAKRVIKALKVVKPDIAPEPKLEELSALLAKFDVKYDLPSLAKNNDVEALYHIQSMLYAMQQDEEDIELLLLTA
jgi:hypothetical protein